MTYLGGGHVRCLWLVCCDDLGEGAGLALAAVRAHQPVPLTSEAGEGVFQLVLVALQLLEFVNELLDRGSACARLF